MEIFKDPILTPLLMKINNSRHYVCLGKVAKILLFYIAKLTLKVAASKFHKHIVL
jgi:hypothetical protein